MFRKLAVAVVTAAALTTPLITATAAHADGNAGCGTYTALMPPQPGNRVMMRPPYDNPYRGTGTVVSVDDDQLMTVDRDVMEDVTTRHEYVRYCDTEEAALASEWGNWAAWPLTP